MDEWTRCPQCGQIAEVVDRDVLPSTDGPVEHVHVRCLAKHRFLMPVVSLARDNEDVVAGSTAARAGAGSGASGGRQRLLLTVTAGRGLAHRS